MILSESDKNALLSMARRTIEQCFEPAGSKRNPGEELTEGLKQRCGAFVSIYVDSQLRGCIGTFSEGDPLWENVKHMARCAATSDNRFKALTADEVKCMEIEISVLTPKKRIHDKREIVPGIHGVYMIRGDQRGTLLPQVAVKQGWTVDELLGNCAKYKAGIGWDGWRSADLYIYEAIVFHSAGLSQEC